MASHDWSNYEFRPSFVLGFHGCDKSVGEEIISGNKIHLNKSEKSYDWLGHGAYFWEGNPQRAEEWAIARKAEGSIQTPFVLGAVIDLRHCLDLFDSYALELLGTAHSELIKTLNLLGAPIPKNSGKTPDNLARHLDCATINFLHKAQDDANQSYDSVRSPFLEGDELYAGAGFKKASHVQLCIRNMNCIKGYFRPVK